jgi:hypothetical protein
VSDRTRLVIGLIAYLGILVAVAYVMGAPA